MQWELLSNGSFRCPHCGFISNKPRFHFETTHEFDASQRCPGSPPELATLYLIWLVLSVGTIVALATIGITLTAIVWIFGSLTIVGNRFIHSKTKHA